MNRELKSAGVVSELSIKTLIFFVLSFILAFMFVPNIVLDLYRYYEDAGSISINQSMFTFANDTYHSNFDFIYYSLFFICKKLRFPFQLVTAVSTGLFYAQSLVLINSIQKKLGYSLTRSNRLLVDIYALLSVSFILVFCISRTITALVFFIFAINYFLKGNKIAIFFFVAACFTHILVVLYLFLFLVGYYLSGLFTQNIKFRKFLLIILTIICFNSLNLINFGLKLISLLPFFSNYSRYADYLIITGRDDFSFLGKWDVILFYSSAFIMLYGLYFIQKYTPLIWVSCFFYMLLTVSLAYSVMLTQRTVLFLVPFQGLISSAFLAQKNNPKEVIVFKLLLYISIILFLINIYSYRMILDFSLPNF